MAGGNLQTPSLVRWFAHDKTSVLMQRTSDRAVGVAIIAFLYAPSYVGERNPTEQPGTGLHRIRDRAGSWHPVKTPGHEFARRQLGRLDRSLTHRANICSGGPHGTGRRVRMNRRARTCETTSMPTMMNRRKAEQSHGQCGVSGYGTIRVRLIWKVVLQVCVVGTGTGTWYGHNW